MTEPIRSFCARVINLCMEVEGATSLTYLNGLKTIATNVGDEAKTVQAIYGGMSRAGLQKKKPTAPEPAAKKKAKKK